jgi:hypothetical protein
MARVISLTYNQVRTNGLFAEAREGEVRWTYFMGELTLRVGTLQLSLEPALERVRVPYASARSLRAFGPLPSSARPAPLWQGRTFTVPLRGWRHEQGCTCESCR